jgi:predicted DCC family thiol-disulfide oxidoreductase YuxK
VPLQAEDLEARYPQVTRAACEREMHLLDEEGRVFRGARAVAEVWRRLPGAWRLLGAVAARPPVAWPAALVYRWVARNRRRLEGSESCAIDP